MVNIYAQDVLELFEQKARRWLNILPRNTCIEQSRILIEVLRRFGVAAEPLATKLHLVCDSCGFQFFSSGDPVDHSNARARTKGVFLRHSDRPDQEYGYHTVVLVERRLFCDLTLAQADAPEFGFRIRPFLFSVPVVPAGQTLAEEWLPDIEAELINDDDIPCRVRWIGVRARDWETTAAWEPSHLWPLINRIEAEMRAG